MDRRENIMKEKRMLTNLLAGNAHINRELYGHFIEQCGRIINDGLFVGRDSEIPNWNGIRLDILEGYRELEVPLLHWPGGTTSEGYHWRKGIGTPRTADIVQPFLGSDDPNTFGTHEFFDLCEYLGCEPYIVCGTSTQSVDEIKEWLQYITAEKPCEMARLRAANGRERPWKLKYFCVGNEWWLYGDAARYISDYKRYLFAAQRFTDHPPTCHILRGPHVWKVDIMRQLGRAIQDGSVGDADVYHPIDCMGMYMVLQSNPDGPAVGFTQAQYYSVFRNIESAEEMMICQLGILRGNDQQSKAKIALDEWGTWYNDHGKDLWDQTVTLRDALVTANVLNMLNRHAAVVEMASVCMSINCLHATMQTRGSRMVKTPVFDVMRMYKRHQNATLVETTLEPERQDTPAGSTEMLSHSASVRDGKLLITLSNVSREESFTVRNAIPYGEYSHVAAEILTGNADAFNSFEQPDVLRARTYNGVSWTEGGVRIVLPPCSVVAVTLQ
jgi:alpha-N-arabinofuranosidase